MFFSCRIRSGSTLHRPETPGAGETDKRCFISLSRESSDKTILSLGLLEVGFTPWNCVINKIVADVCSLYKTTHERVKNLSDFGFPLFGIDDNPVVEDDEEGNDGLDDSSSTSTPNACGTLYVTRQFFPMIG
jgi:hypothetical protein